MKKINFFYTLAMLTVSSSLWGMFSSVNTLRQAFCNGNLKEVESILHENRDCIQELVVSVGSPSHVTFSHVAAKNGDANMVALFAKYSCFLKARDMNNNTPLHYATSEAVAKVLIENGADVNALNNNKQTSLHTAVKHGSQVNNMQSSISDKRTSDEKRLDIVKVICYLMDHVDRSLTDNNGEKAFEYYRLK